MRGRASFFYVRLQHQAPQSSDRSRGPSFASGGVDYVLLAHGLGQWLERVDRSYDYLTGPGGTASDGNPSVVAEILDWASGEGFPETFERLTGGQLRYSSARQYRERFLLAALKR